MTRTYPKQYGSGDVACRHCGRLTRWATTVPKGFKILLDADAADDGVYRFDQVIGADKVENQAKWVHEPYRADLRQRIGLHSEHDCPALARKSA